MCVWLLVMLKARRRIRSHQRTIKGISVESPIVLQEEHFEHFTVIRGEREAFIDLSRGVSTRSPWVRDGIRFIAVAAPDPWPDELIVLEEGKSIYLPFRARRSILRLFSDESTNEIRMKKVTSMVENRSTFLDPEGGLFKTHVLIPMDLLMPKSSSETSQAKTQGLSGKNSEVEKGRMRTLSALCYRYLVNEDSRYSKAASEDEFVSAVLEKYNPPE